MSDSLIWTLLGHLVCIAQWAAFILVDYAYLGRGRRFRHPCVWAALLALAVLALSVLCGFGFFNIKSVVSNIIYLLVIALLFGGTAVDRMSACIINGILCLLTENTVSFVFARLHGICPGEVWHYRTCLAALVISILLVGILAARFLCRWNHCSALDPLQALLMSFFPGVVVLLNIFIMISSNRRVPTLLDLMLTVGLTIAVLVHLAIVISNLLDNAIRAAAQAKPPEVYLRARKNEEEYLISVRNRVQKDLELVDGELPRSTKAEPGHGMGLVNVREVLDRCRCEYTLSCRDRWFRFTCAVPTRKL